jgi:hypothetical protein
LIWNEGQFLLLFGRTKPHARLTILGIDDKWL